MKFDEEKWVEFVRSVIVASHPNTRSFTVNGPSVAITTTTSERILFLGGELIYLSGIYLNTSNIIIYAFKDMAEDEYIEMQVDKAINELDGFEEFIEKLAVQYDANVANEKKPEVAPAPVKNNPLFGSW